MANFDINNLPHHQPSQDSSPEDVGSALKRASSFEKSLLQKEESEPKPVSQRTLRASKRKRPEAEPTELERVESECKKLFQRYVKSFPEAGKSPPESIVEMFDRVVSRAEKLKKELDQANQKKDMAKYKSAMVKGL
jgi:hypothetical protein